LEEVTSGSSSLQGLSNYPYYNSSLQGTFTTSESDEGDVWEVVLVDESGEYRTANCNGEMSYIYTNPQQFFSFPMEYGDTLSDEFFAEYNFTMNGIAYNYVRYGTTNSKIDAYGTLILPDYTFENTLRLFLTEDYKDEYRWADGEVLMDFSYHTETYAWQVKGTLMGYLSMYKLYFLDLDEEIPYTQFTRFHNYVPVSGVFYETEEAGNPLAMHSIEPETETYSKIQIYSSHGQLIGLLEDVSSAVNIPSFLKSVGYSSGIYILSKIDGSKVEAETIFVR